MAPQCGKRRRRALAAAASRETPVEQGLAAANRARSTSPTRFRAVPVLPQRGRAHDAAMRQASVRCRGAAWRAGLAGRAVRGGGRRPRDGVP